MRFYWLLPAEFLCAYLLARLVNRKAKREVQFAVGVVVLGIVFLCGSSLVKYIPDENVYKIDSWVLETSELIAEASKKENPVILVDQEMYSSIRQYDPTVIEAVNNTEMARYMFTDTEELPVDGQYDDHSTAVSLFVKGVEVDASIMNEILQSARWIFLYATPGITPRNTCSSWISPMSARWKDMKYTGVRKSKEGRGRCLQF